MSLKLYEETDIQSIANSIRGKNGTTNTYKVSEMSSAIDAIETGSGSSEWQPPFEGLVYSDGETHVLSNSYLDTNQAILSTDSDFTIFVKFKGSSNNNLTNGKQYDFLHCINEASPWPGIGIDIYNGKYRLCALQKTVLTEIDGTDEEERKFFIDHTNGSNLINLTGDLGNLSLSGTWYNVNQTLIFGANRTTSNVFTKYWSGEIYQILIYNRVLTDEEKEGIYNGASTIKITEDGKYNVSSYDIARVKVLDSLTETLKITSNGVYDVKNYAKAEVVVPSSGDWTAEEDWWDIDTILENDTEDYPAKIIFLLNNSNDTTNFQSLNSTKIVCSDGTVYEPNNSAVWYEHSWDTTKDKECSLGYKTRYIIFCYSGTSVTLGNSSTVWGNSYGSSYQFLYGIVDGFTSFSSPSIINGCSNIQMMKYINTKNTSTNLNISNCNNLINLIGYVNDNLTNIYGGNTNKFVGFNYIDLSKVTTIQAMYQGNNSINKIVYPSTLDLSKIKSYYGTFNSFAGNVIEKIDFTSCTSTANIMNSAPNITSIIEILGQLKVSTNIGHATGLNHDTLIRFINCLYDYAAEGSTDTYTLTLGTTLLAKLTDEEKAIATNKGWTLN